ncbi:MAG: response regulator [Flavobacteriales bacterium]|nr:response regulator [Flavobacteriales bacterium]
MWRKIALLLVLPFSQAVFGQSVDSLRSVANDAARDHADRVQALRVLHHVLGLSAAELAAEPAVMEILRDTTSSGLVGSWARLLQATVLFKRGGFALCASLCDIADRGFGSAKDEVGSALARSQKGEALNMMGDQASAMRLYFSALDDLQRSGIRYEEANLLLRLSWVFNFQGDRDKCREYERRAMAMARSAGFEALEADALRIEGDLHMETDSTGLAAEFYEQALAFYTRLGGASRIAVASTQLANVRLELGDLIGARRSFEEALAAFEQAKNDVWISYVNSRLAEVCHAMHEYRAALGYAMRGLSVARERGLFKESVDNLQALPKIHAALGDYQSALRYSQEFAAMRDSMVSNAIASEMMELDLRQQQMMDSLTREEELSLEAATYRTAATKAGRQRNLFLFAGIGVMVISIGLWSRLRQVGSVRRELAAGNALIEEEKLRAERSEKVKEQFLANMSHEIRTPMNAIMGMTGILRRNEHLPSQQKFLDAITQSSENLLVILNDILDLDQLEAGKVELESVAFSPRKVLTNVLDILRFKAEEKGLELRATIADEVPEQVMGDPTRLHQVLLNLAGNGIKFTERGGVKIELVVQQREQEKVVLRARVIDTGIGIVADKLDGIFEEFTQAYSDTTRKYGGTGLGLTISKRYVELQGGTITVESAKDKGSVFTVTVPYGALAEAGRPLSGNEGAMSADPDSSRIVLRGLRILLVEDNEFNVMVAQDELADAIPDVQVDHAANGRIAVEKVGANQYDVVLMDLQMPEMDGYEAARAIRSLSGNMSRVPIIALSANVLKSEVDKCMEAGMDGFVPKPFERKDLLEKLTQALSKNPGR